MITANHDDYTGTRSLRAEDGARLKVDEYYGAIRLRASYEDTDVWVVLRPGQAWQLAVELLVMGCRLLKTRTTVKVRPPNGYRWPTMDVTKDFKPREIP